MRTNSWLFLINMGQWAGRLQQDKIAREQAERDAGRDAAFDHASAVAKAGQYAMWIQTEDGRRFDTWNRHAETASRDLGDRNAAWEAAWDMDAQERQERRDQQVGSMRAAAEQRARATVRRPEPESPMRFIAFAACAFVAMVACGAGFLVLGEFPGFEPIMFGLMVLAAGLFGVTAWMVYKATEVKNVAEKKYAAALQDVFDRYLNEAQRQGGPLPDGPVGDTRFSWHARHDLGTLRSFDQELQETSSSAPERFPRGDALQPLAGVYATRSAPPAGVHVPEAIEKLLAAFRVEDAERRAALAASGIA